MNIYTAEALAIVDGSELKNLGPGGREMKNKTIEFLESSNETARITKLEAELESVKARNEMLEEDNKLIWQGQAAAERVRQHVGCATARACPLAYRRFA